MKLYPLREPCYQISLIVLRGYLEQSNYKSYHTKNMLLYLLSVFRASIASNSFLHFYVRFKIFGVDFSTSQMIPYLTNITRK